MTGLLIDSRCLTFKESYWSFTKLILDNFCSVSLVWHESRTSIAILWFELVDRVEFLSSTPIFGHLSMISTLYQTPDFVELIWQKLCLIVRRVSLLLSLFPQKESRKIFIYFLSSFLIYNFSIFMIYIQKFMYFFIFQIKTSLFRRF